MDPVPDPLLLRKSGSVGNRTRDLLPAILHLLKLSAVVTLDTGASAEQDDVIYHHCLLEENCGQKVAQKSVHFLPVVMILKTSLS